MLLSSYRLRYGMAEFVTLCKTSDVAAGQSKAFPFDKRMIALFHLADGTWRAIDDYCPHMGASLAEGTVCDGVVQCPWHAWEFSLETGKWVNSPKLKIACYDVYVEGDEVKVRQKE
jgi:nitrite reductase (NADH) small subunit